MKKAILISCFDWYKDRIVYYEKHLQEIGYEVQVWMSDYKHFEKVRIEPIEGCHYIHVYAYKNNLSLTRLLSHYDFSRKVYNVLNREQPDVVIALIPPNSVAKICGKYKRDHPHTKLIFDVIDMWPESYPALKAFKTPFRLWKFMRDNNLKYADLIFTECALYQNFLPVELKQKMSVLYLFRDSSNFAEIPVWTGKKIDIGYLGSINNLIDILQIERMIVDIRRFMKVTVHIVGGGSNTQNFIEALIRAGADIENYGVIFDKGKIRSIIGRCHFALNMMKPSVCVGLTIKSMEYFQMGVPMFNTIKGDTKDIIDEYACGYNVNETDGWGERLYSLKSKDYVILRKNTQNVFLGMFTVKSFENNLEMGLKQLDL